MSKSKKGRWSFLRYLVIREHSDHASGDEADEEEGAEDEGGRRCGWRLVRWQCRLVGKVATSHLSLVLILVLYTFAGAAIFEAVESSQEMEIKKDLKISRQFLLQSVWNRSLGKNDSWEQFRQFVSVRLARYERDLLQASHHGITGVTDRHWDYWSAMFFCATVFTTVGYGNLAPATTAGRWLTVIYASIGIPLCLVVLADMGRLNTRILQFLATKTYHGFRRFKRRLLCCARKKTFSIQNSKSITSSETWGKCSSSKQEVTLEEEQAQPATAAAAAVDVAMGTNRVPIIEKQRKGSDEEDTDISSSTDEEEENGEETIHVHFILPLAITIVYMLLGVFLYTRWEPWDFTTAFYFIFVSFFTIGFGDIVPTHPRYFLASSIYVLFGLSLVATIVNVIMEMMSRTFNKAKDSAQRSLGLRGAVPSVAKQQLNIMLKIRNIGSRENVTLPMQEQGDINLNENVKISSNNDV